ncbi:MAG: NTE family protein [Myxococcota bacterium]|jgi:NTE family protein
MTTASPARRTALVLSAGGSWGAIQVGMLHALVEAGVRWDLIVGSSAGALNGAFLATGQHADALPALTAAWGDADHARLFWPAPVHGLGALLGTRDAVFRAGPLSRWIKRHLTFDRLERAAQPLHIVATDLQTGDEVLLSEGPALEALLASSAIPGLFPPVEIGGRVLVDGAIGAYTPVHAAVRLGATELIVLTTNVVGGVTERPRGALNISLQAINLVMLGQLRCDLQVLVSEASDVTVRLPPPPVRMPGFSGDFSHSEALIADALGSTRAWIAAGGLSEDGSAAAVLDRSFGARAPG